MRPKGLTERCREAGAIILKVAYGYTVEPHRQDPFVEIADQALAQFSAATVAGVWLVDTIPACSSNNLFTVQGDANRSSNLPL